jgi:hypothetical protein
VIDKKQSLHHQKNKTGNKEDTKRMGLRTLLGRNNILLKTHK